MTGKEKGGLLERVCNVFSTGFGAGYTPSAPGTAGAILGIPVGLLINGLPGYWSPIALLILIAFSCLCAQVTERVQGEKDPQIVVIDEIVGMAVALWALPTSLIMIAIQFLLFRLFDIYKPFPVKQMEEIFTGGAGIVMDDVMAGIMANCLYRIGRLFLA